MASVDANVPTLDDAFTIIETLECPYLNGVMGVVAPEGRGNPDREVMKKYWRYG